MSVTTRTSGGRPELHFSLPDCYVQSLPQELYENSSRGLNPCRYTFDSADPVESAVCVRCTNAVFSLLKTELADPIQQTGLEALQIAQKPLDMKTVQKVTRIIGLLERYSVVLPEEGEECGYQELYSDLRKRVVNVIDCSFEGLGVILVKFRMQTGVVDEETAIKECFLERWSLADGIAREAYRRIAIDMLAGVDIPSLKKVYDLDWEVAQSRGMSEAGKMEWFERRRRNLVMIVVPQVSKPLLIGAGIGSELHGEAV